MKKRIIPALLIFVIFMSFGFSENIEQDKKAKKEQQIVQEKAELQKQFVSVLKTHCAVSGCHKGKYPKKKLNLEEDQFLASLVDVTSLEIDSLKLVDTENPEQSYLLMKVRGDKGIVDQQMPVDAPPLKAEEIEIVEKWIASLKVPASDVKEKIKGEKKNLKKMIKKK